MNPSRTHSKPNYGLSIQAYLLLVIASVAIPMLILVAIIAWDYSATARRTIEASRFDAVNDLVNLLDREIQTTAEFLNGLAVYPRIQTGELEIIPKLATVASEHGVEVIGLFDHDGHLLFNSAAATMPDFPSAESVGVSKVIDGRKTFVSDLLARDASRAGLIYVSVPCVIEGNVAFVLVGGFSPSRLQELFSQAGLQENWVGGVVDRTGVLIARSLNAPTYVGRYAKEGVVAAARGSQPTGLFENTSREGILMENAFHRSKSGWMAFVAVPAAVLQAALWRTTLTMTMIGLALTAIGLAISVLIARRISREIHQLGYASVAIAAGDNVKLPTSTIAELQKMSRSLEMTSARKNQATI